MPRKKSVGSDFLVGSTKLPGKVESDYENTLWNKTLQKEIEAAIKFNEDGSDQKQQVTLLLRLEEQFRKSLLRYQQSRAVYERFILKIVVENKNILSARPYFRERSPVFVKSISPAIKGADAETLQKFHINYQLISFIRDNWRGKFPQESERLFQKISGARRVIIENNMPLAINRAAQFYRKTPRSQLSLMDLIGICAAGLVSGVDKFVGPYTPVFRAVCIGRMVGNMIDDYSKTLLYFSPSDRKFLYRANSLKARNKIEDVDELAEAVNESMLEEFEDKKGRAPQISASDLRLLVGAASHVSADGISEDVGTDRFFSDTMDREESPEEILIKTDARAKIADAIKRLPLIEQKLLALKGVDL